MALVAAEMNTKQNSNASIVQEMKEQILVSSAFNHSILKKKKRKYRSPPDVSVKHRKNCFVKFSFSKKKKGGEKKYTLSLYSLIIQ